jgi:hypothetical protein
MTGFSSPPLTSGKRSKPWRECDELERPLSPEQLWEEGFDEGLTEAQYSAIYARSA